MKKLLVSVLVLFECLTVFAQIKTPYTEFMANNPFLDMDVYVLNPNLLKGKYLKTVSEEYDINSAGRKVYGDGYGVNTGIWYYKFNDENILEKKCFLVKQEDRIWYKKTWTYSETGNEYFVTYKNYRGSEVEVTEEKYSITRNKDGWNVILESFNAETESSVTLKINDTTKLKLEQKYDWDPYKTVYTFENPTCLVKYYNGDELQRTYLYHNGRMIMNVQEQYLETGKIIEQTEFDKQYITGIAKSQILMSSEVIEEKVKGKIERTYNPKGYLECEQRTPYEGSVGMYETYTVEILDAPDSLFEQYFTE